jgi:YebC/PmpR family DNA-binding regulatory protein
MSGHSKWNNIKRTKEKTDAQKAKIFTKLGREILVAIKTGGADPETNSRLKDAIAKAKQNNMPNDNINRMLKKHSGENDNVDYEEIIYEGYGVGGVAVIVKCLTDNRNRTAGDVRHAFDKHGGSLGTPGSVMFMFDKKGVILVDKNADFDALFELVLENDGDNLEQEDEGFVITTKPECFSKVLAALEKANYNVLSSSIDYVCATTIALDENKRTSFEKMIDMLEELDDVQEVYHNAELD